ncbi:hypothetical protein WDL1P1_00310 (plasmid) [Variovorax sp. WDL1]|nr:hypothetical protein WDL1P1_00310 [Variovorax sp. WDL1]
MTVRGNVDFCHGKQSHGNTMFEALKLFLAGAILFGLLPKSCTADCTVCGRFEAVDGCSTLSVYKDGTAALVAQCIGPARAPRTEVYKYTLEQGYDSDHFELFTTGPLQAGSSAPFRISMKRAGSDDWEPVGYHQRMDSRYRRR